MRYALYQPSYSSFSRRLGGLLVLWMLSFSSWALSPDIEADRLMLAAKNYLAAGDQARAAESLERIEKLQVEPPVDYHFYKGRVDWHYNNAEESKNALEQYVQKAGKEGEHYVEALTLLTKIEETHKVGAASTGQPGEASIQWQKKQGVHSDEYVERLRKLYLKDKPQDALVEHINSLLATAPFRPSRIVTADQREGIRYSMSLGGKGVVVMQETRFDATGNASVNLDRRDVFGVDPYVRYGCDNQRRACWMLDPQGTHKEWILLADNKDIAEDLAKALTKLILILQNPA